MLDYFLTPDYDFFEVPGRTKRTGEGHSLKRPQVDLVLLQGGFLV